MTVHEHACRVLSAGVDSEADGDDVVLATAHVERCADCQREAGRFAKVVEAVAALLPEAPPVWLDGFGERLPAQLPAPPPPPQRAQLRAAPRARLGGLGRRHAAAASVAAAPELGGVTLVTLPAPDAVQRPAMAAANPARPAAASRPTAATVARGLSAVTWVATVAAACLLVIMAAAWVRGRLESGTVVPTATAATDVRMSATVAVRSWAQAVAAGNTEGAWSLLSPRARDAVGGRAGFGRRMPRLRGRYRSLLAEARNRGGSERAVLLAGGDSEVRSVVILTVGGDGPAAAVPVVTAGGTSLVEPFEPAISLSLRRSGRNVLVGVRPAGATIRVVIDDGGPVRPAPGPVAGGAEVTVRAALDPGSHVVVATAIDAEGRIAAKTVVLRVS